MTAALLLDDLIRRGVEIVAAGDRLRYRPATAIDPDLREKMAEHKTELLELLRSAMLIRGPQDLPGDWRVDFEERAAIREHDGGQAREHAEAEALQEVIASMRAAGVNVVGDDVGIDPV